MDEAERERRRRAVEEARDLLRDLDSAAALRAASRAMPHATPMQSCGVLPLLSSARSERFRAEAEEWQRKCEQERERREQEEQRMREQQQQAAERAARLEMTEELTEVLGQVIAEERHRMREHVAEQIGLLRAELTVQRTAERGQILDLPALPMRRRGNAA